MTLAEFEEIEASTDELRRAPYGASGSECAVCFRKTLIRIVEGDGHIPICSVFCLRVWPRVHGLLVEIDNLKAKKTMTLYE